MLMETSGAAHLFVNDLFYSVGKIQNSTPKAPVTEKKETLGMVWCLGRISFFTSILPFYKLNHAGLSVLAVISRMATGCLFGLHFFSVFGAFKFHRSAPELGICSKKLSGKTVHLCC